MTNHAAVAVRPGHGTIAAVPRSVDDELTIIRNTYAKDLTDEEFGVFVADARHRGLDIVNKEIVAIKFQGRMSPFVTIGGARKLAERSGKYAGSEGPYWCGKDGVWVEVWLANEPPAAAKFIVYRHDSNRPVVGIATWRERAQLHIPTWKAMPALMLGKVAEMDALKRARLFPDDLAVSVEAGYQDEAIDTTFSPKTGAMRHLHGVGKERGLDHGDLRNVVTAIRPGTSSMTDPAVDARDLGAAADLIDALDDEAVEAIVAEPERMAEPAAQTVAPWEGDEVSYGGDHVEDDDGFEVQVPAKVIAQWVANIDRVKTVRQFAAIEKTVFGEELDRVPAIDKALKCKRGELGIPEEADAEMASAARGVMRTLA